MWSAMGSDTDEDRFRALFEAEARGVLGYALRRVEDREDAADVVAETFSVAWRRIADVPAGAEARLWLYGVARRTLANQRRGTSRRRRLSARLREHVRLSDALRVPEPDERADAVRRALRALSEQDREVLLLANWEGLTPAEIAAVIGVPPATARTRLHRARARLRDELRRSGLVPSGATAPRGQIEEAR
jgi:RNA polymerase sigma-70 factor (ECF subfamily)